MYLTAGGWQRPECLSVKARLHAAVSGTWAQHRQTHWEGCTWAEGAASPPPCLPQKSVPQKLFGVTERLFGSTNGMKRTILHSVPQNKKQVFLA